MLIWTRNVEMLEGSIGKTLQDTGIDKSILKRTPSGSSTNAGKDMKTQQTSHTVSGNVKQCSCYRRRESQIQRQISCFCHMKKCRFKISKYMHIYDMIGYDMI